MGRLRLRRSTAGYLESENSVFEGHHNVFGLTSKHTQEDRQQPRTAVPTRRRTHPCVWRDGQRPEELAKLAFAHRVALDGQDRTREAGHSHLTHTTERAHRHGDTQITPLHAGQLEHRRHDVLFRAIVDVRADRVPPHGLRHPTRRRRRRGRVEAARKDQEGGREQDSQRARTLSARAGRRATRSTPDNSQPSLSQPRAAPTSMQTSVRTSWTWTWTSRRPHSSEASGSETATHSLDEISQEQQPAPRRSRQTRRATAGGGTGDQAAARRAAANAARGGARRPLQKRARWGSRPPPLRTTTRGTCRRARTGAWTRRGGGTRSLAAAPRSRWRG